MKRFSYRFIAVILSVVLAGLFSPDVFAAGTTLIDLSTKNPAVGESVSMTVTGSESSTITVRYNASVLNFSNCNVTGYVAEGNSVTFTAASGIVTFTAASSGSSNLIVSSDTLTGSSTSVTVSGGSEAATSTSETANSETASETAGNEASSSEAAVQETEATDATTEAETTDAGTAADVPSDYDFMVGDTAYVVSERFSDNEIPSGFERVTLTIHEKTYRELQNGEVVLVYLKPAADTSGSGTFYFYDANSDTVAPTVMLGTKDDYILQIAADPFSELLTPATYTSEELNFSGYQVTGAANEFYYVYGMAKDGTLAWYTYDTSSNAYLRTNVEAFTALSSYVPSAGDEAEGEEDVEDEGSKTSLSSRLSGLTSRDNLRKIIALLVLVLAIIIVIFINISVARRRQEEDEDIFDDDYDDDEEDDDRKYEEPLVKRTTPQTAKLETQATAQSTATKTTAQVATQSTATKTTAQVATQSTATTAAAQPSASMVKPQSQEEEMEQKLKEMMAASDKAKEEVKAEAKVKSDEVEIKPVLIKPEDINPEFKDTPVSKVDNFETKRSRHKSEGEKEDINLVDLNDL